LLTATAEHCRGATQYQRQEPFFSLHGGIPFDSIDVVLPEALRSRQKIRSIRSESLIINHSEVVVHALAGYIEG